MLTENEMKEVEKVMFDDVPLKLLMAKDQKEADRNIRDIVYMLRRKLTD